MKPYIAILIDSFWEAIGNKVLWALLIGWSIVLLGLAPFGYVSERSFRLSSVDIDDRSELVEKLIAGAQGRGGRSIRAVVEQLDPSFRERLISLEDKSDSAKRMQESLLAKELNVAISSRELYSEEDFPTAQRRKRLEPLTAVDSATLSDEDVEELNRELLQLAFPLQLTRPRGEQLWVGYAGFKIGEPLPVSRRQISQVIEPILLSFIIKLGLGVLAVFVAIVVTSPIIPDTFRSGSLHLLLSKPISRIWLYLSKFFGGCIFVLLNITFVLVGLYFIAGLRFDIWNEGLLACIPLLMFVFVIFYSVSAFIGLLWGNAIVCVVSCMVFWLLCFSLGFLRNALLPQFEVVPQIGRIGDVAGDVLVVNGKGDVSVWNDQFSVWQPAIESENGGLSRTFGPFYDAERKELLVKSFFRNPFGNLTARSRNLSLVRMGEQAVQADAAPAIDSDIEQETVPSASAVEEVPQSAAEARKQAVWLSDPGPEPPRQLLELLQLQRGIVAVCRDGLHKLDMEKFDAINGNDTKLPFGFKLPWGVGSAFEKVTPADYTLSDNAHAAVTANGTGVVIYSAGTIDHLVWQDGKMIVERTTKMEDESDGTEAALPNMNDDYCVVARKGFPIAIFNAQLEPLSDVELPQGQEPRQLAWIPGTNNIAIVTHQGGLLKLDCERAEVESLATPFNGSHTSMNWIDQDSVWLGVKPNRVYKYNVATGDIVESYAPRTTIWERIFRWGIKPVYAVNPKPTALDNAMSYLLSGNQTESLSIVTRDLEAAQLELDIWQPIISNLLFVAVMLGIGCIYVARKEF